MRQSQINSLLDDLEEICCQHANPDDAFFMSKYMKNKFEFLGIKKPVIKEISKPFLQTIKKDYSEAIIEIAKLLWQKKAREYQYIALELLEFWAKKCSNPFLTETEVFLTQKSWWDTVDALSVNVAGVLLKRFPNQISETIASWNQSENMWLNRAAILYQLKWKTETNTPLLSEIILAHSNSKEFFIQKAIGWVLRENSKRNPDFVLDFLNTHSLKPLSVREASKYL